MDNQELIRRYAEITVRLGANVAPGQIVGITAHLGHAEFARALAAECYRAGARFVDVWYWDPHIKRARVEHATDEDTLSWTPPWLDERYELITREKGAYISIVGDAAPNLLSDLDPRRAGRDQMPRLPSRLKLVHSEQVNWSIVAFPTVGWARTVYGEPDMQRLWGEISAMMRLDQPDPVAAWQEHIDMLHARARALTAASFDAIHFLGPGTDLKVGMIDGHRWIAAGFETRWGRKHLPNMPTEEIFTTPHMDRAEGTVTSTRPLSLQGNVVEGLVVRFEGGRIVEVDATEGLDVIKGEIARDDGAPRLGEIALVDKASKVGETGVTYFETLLDENATSHIAYGAGYPQAVPGAEDTPEEEWTTLGVNTSGVHTDFMIGGPEVEVYGVDASGKETPIITENTWRLEG